MLAVNDQDLQELIEEFQALPSEERPKAIEALVYLEDHGVINPPVSGVFLARLEAWVTIQ